MQLLLRLLLRLPWYAALPIILLLGMFIGGCDPSGPPAPTSLISYTPITISATKPADSSAPSAISAGPHPSTPPVSKPPDVNFNPAPTSKEVTFYVILPASVASDKPAIHVHLLYTVTGEYTNNKPKTHDKYADHVFEASAREKYMDLTFDPGASRFQEITLPIDSGFKNEEVSVRVEAYIYDNDSNAAVIHVKR